MRKLSKEEFGKIYEDHKHFIKQDCTGWEDMCANFENCSFEDLHFDSDHPIYLARANFKNANLKGINFKRSDLDSANFEDANLEGIYLKDANIIGANFQRANLTNADLSGCICNNVNFKYAKLNNADLSGSYCNESKFEFTNLINANLSDSTCTYANFDCANLSNSNIDHTQFDNSNLTGTIFEDAKGKFARFYNSNLYNAIFTNADIEYVVFSYTYIRNTKFYKTNIENGIFSNAHLDTVKFDDCNMSHTDFESSNIIDTKFDNGVNTEYMNGKILTDNIIGYKKCRRMYYGMSRDEFLNCIKRQGLPLFPTMSISNYTYIPHSASKEDEVIVTLEIPRGAIVFSINGHKCRTNKAKVIAIDGADKAISLNYRTSYYVGDEFTIYNFDCVYNHECGEGIHFFLTREEAEKYIY